MKKKALIIISIIIPVIFLFNACALEIANVIGPGGGYVYYDKGNYKNGWRYKECSPFDIGEIKGSNFELPHSPYTEITLDSDDPSFFAYSAVNSLKRALRLCEEQSDDWYAFEWELPDEADLKKILECFSYGLTRFSPDYYYLAINNMHGFDINDEDTWLEVADGKWEDIVVILHKNFDTKANGEVERVNVKEWAKEWTDGKNPLRIRPIRKF